VRKNNEQKQELNKQILHKLLRKITESKGTLRNENESPPSIRLTHSFSAESTPAMILKRHEKVRLNTGYTDGDGSADTTRGKKKRRSESPNKLLSSL
jgi:hypothetical protein